MSAAIVQPRLAFACLTGELVCLRPLTSGDVEPAFSLLNGNEDILRWLVWDGPRSPDDMIEHYSRWARHGEGGSDYQFAICEREGGRFVGSIGPRFGGHPGRGDVGYWLDPAVWGRGYMSEAVRLVTHLCFRWLGATAMYAYVFVGNGGSRRVLERAGYRLEHTAEKMTLKRGVPVDEWCLAVAGPEWEASFAEWRPLEEAVRLEDG